MAGSHRLPTSLQPNRWTECLRELRASGIPLLDLTLTNPLRCGFTYPETAIRAALAHPNVLDYAPDPLGARPAREAIAAWHGHGVHPDDVVLTTSTSEAYGWLFKLLTDPGDTILVPSPSYPLFEGLARLEGIQVRSVPSFHQDGWHLNPSAFEDAFTERTRAVVIVQPNNPTGHHLARHEWDWLTAWCASHDLPLLVDEVFHDYPLECPSDRLPTALEDVQPPCPVFMLSGLSKVALLPQVKLGWIVLRGSARTFRESLAFLADHYLSVSASAQAAAPALLEWAPELQSQVRQRLWANLNALDQALGNHPSLQRLLVEGGWSVILRHPALDSDEAYALRLLQEAHTLVHPGHFYDLPGDGHTVLSLIVPPSDFQEGLRRILPLLSA